MNHKITAVELQKKNTRRFNIYLDGKFAFGADVDLVVSRRLVVGKEIVESDLEKILFEAEVGKLMERMYRLFSIRQRSEKEVRDYFRKKNLESRVKNEDEMSQLVVDAAVETLKKKGMIDDEQFARGWTEARRKSRYKGLRAIRSELFQKGIDREIVEKVISEDTVDSEESLAQKALDKKLRVWENLPAVEFKKKAYGFLMRRGFDYQVVKNVVANVLKRG